ncbi:hypothetical protein RRG08_030138 [Elysia crispata]|uniref:Uncharacterized protein n=1 Tax=Elysia crispata TaxID=231223 RepID=A0AAE0ZSB6_9GAST|nr:hypothetical protein RRG08_030138 [Elysia crispata]
MSPFPTSPQALPRSHPPLVISIGGSGASQLLRDQKRRAGKRNLKYSAPVKQNIKTSSKHHYNSRPTAGAIWRGFCMIERITSSAPAARSTAPLYILRQYYCAELPPIPALVTELVSMKRKLSRPLAAGDERQGSREST